MDPTTIAAGIGGVIGAAVVSGLRWIARRTKSKTDDAIVDRVEQVVEYLAMNPQALDLLRKLLLHK